MNTADR